MASKQLAISLDETLVLQVKEAAERSRGGNVSAWLADAAHAQLRYEAAKRVLDELVSEQGAVSEAAIAEVRRQWPAD
jgi:hypothetical protein